VRCSFFVSKDLTGLQFRINLNPLGLKKGAKGGLGKPSQSSYLGSMAHGFKGFLSGVLYVQLAVLGAFLSGPAYGGPVEDALKT
jgi:hypothetical protein